MCSSGTCAVASAGGRGELLAKEYPPRPYMPPVFVLMVLLVVALNLLLYRVVPLGFVVRLQEAPVSELEQLSMSTLTFEIEADASKTETGYLVQASTSLPSGRSAKVWLSSSDELELGERVQAIGRFSANEGDEWGVSNRAKGISGRVKVYRVVERAGAAGPKAVLISLRSWVLAQIKPEQNAARALLAGVISARRTELKTTGTDQSFARAGLSHLIAVSGSHLVVVAAMLESLLIMAGLGPKARTIATLFVTGIYVLFCASPASAVRSWVMLAISRSSVFVSRRSYSVSGIGVAGILMCLIDPTVAADLGFQLSVLSVTALSLFAPWARALMANCFVHPRIELPRKLWRVSKLMRKPLRELQEILIASLVCQVATLFSCAYTFGTLSLVAPLANCVVGPLFSPLVVLGIAGCVLSVVPGLGALVLNLAELVAWACILAAGFFAKLPLAQVPVAMPALAQATPLILGAVIYIIWPMPRARQIRLAGAAATAALTVYFLAVTVFVPAQITVLDVGQGDAILVRQGPHSLLIDAGPGGALTEALARNHVYWLDAVVLTHLHDDHAGGLEDLVDTIGVGTVYVAQGVSDDIGAELAQAITELTGNKAQEIKAGNQLKLGEFSFECLWPKADNSGQENEDSLILLARYNTSFKMLLTGDAETSTLSQVAREVGDIDILKVGHHGSAVSISAAEATTLTPELAIASAGEGNSYGHPTQECIETLTAAGATFTCTIDHGDITVFPAKPIRVAFAK